MQTSRAPVPVLYLHHTRDADGDVLFYFVDPARCGDGDVLQSSPIVGLKRLPALVVQREGVAAGKGRYLISTANTDYAVQLSHERAAHLARELGLPGAPGTETRLEATAKQRGETRVNPRRS